MKCAELTRQDLVFMQHDPDWPEQQLVIAVTRLSEAMAHLPVVPVDVDLEFAEYVRQNRGLEPHRLDALRHPGAWQPVLFIQMPDDSWLLVDGNHRYAVAAEVGWGGIAARLVTREEWAPFVIEDYPYVPDPVLQIMPSGL